MLDVQKERLRHMVANAILELWKKETGSLTPVIIEGTICITAGSGRTTVVQVANHFSGSIPDNLDDNGPMFHTPKRKLMNIKPIHYSSPLVSPSLQPTYIDEYSPIAFKSPGFILPSRIDCQKHNSRKPLRSNASSEQSMDISSLKEEEETTDVYEEAETDVAAVPKDNKVNVSDVVNKPGESSISGTGIFAEEKSNEEKRSTSESNKDEDSDPSQEKQDYCDDAFTGDALDLSSSRSKEDDLAISSPQNYTAQVRNVIRQRLLASRQNSNESPTVDDNTEEQSKIMPKISEFTGLSPLPPLTNLNLNSPSLIPMPYNSVISASPSAFTPLNDVPSRSPQDNQLISPGLISPGGRSSTTSPFDQNGNNKETLYVNDKGETQKVYKCNFCSKTFLFKSKYYEHLPVHTNVRPFQCNLCSRTYKYKYDLRVHVRTHMGIPTKSTVCPFCSVKFDTNKMLRLHIQDFHRSNTSVDANITSSGESSSNNVDRSEDVGTST